MNFRRGLLDVLGRLVDHDGVVGLVLDLTLGPLLLLTRDVGITSESACESIASERQSAWMSLREIKRVEGGRREDGGAAK